MSSSRDSIMNAFRMKGGDGENSYANNSAYQRNVLSETQLVVEENIREMLMKLDFPEYIKLADLGCSSGPNTYLAMSGMVNTIIDSYQEKGRINLPEIDCFLNDLSENDFNTTFKWLHSFHEGLKTDLKGRCFVSGTPGSFYSKLFPRQSLHFVHSSYSIHWLSKVPQGLKEDDNKKSVFINSSSPQNVYKSYLDQFQIDFSLFLKMRSEEIMPNGRMVLAFIGRDASDPLYRDPFHIWSVLSESLIDLVSEGVVKESEVDAFNMPFYDPNEGEVKEVVEKEGSFEINMIETRDFFAPYASKEDVVDETPDRFKQLQKMDGLVKESEVDAFNMPFYDPNEGEVKEVVENEGSFEINMIETRDFFVAFSSGEDVVDETRDEFKKWQKIANIVRCISESILVPHFGEAIMDRLFHRYAINVAKHLTISTRPLKTTVNLVVSLTRK